MGEIEDAIERADREVFTKEPPKTLQGRINYLMRQLGSAKPSRRNSGSPLTPSIATGAAPASTRPWTSQRRSTTP